MGISLRVSGTDFPIGTASLFKAFFSTVYVRVENRAWGSRFPVIMRRLYDGQLPADVCAAARDELREIRSAFAKLPPSQMVWDFENPAASPPWGTNISPTIRTLADYFVTSEGVNLLDLMDDAFKQAKRKAAPVTVG